MSSSLGLGDWSTFLGWMASRGKGGGAFRPMFKYAVQVWRVDAGLLRRQWIACHPARCGKRACRAVELEDHYVFTRKGRRNLAVLVVEEKLRNSK